MLLIEMWRCKAKVLMCKSENTEERSCWVLHVWRMGTERGSCTKERQQELMEFTSGQWKLATTGNWVGPFPALFSFLAHVDSLLNLRSAARVGLGWGVSSEMRCCIGCARRKAAVKSRVRTCRGSNGQLCGVIQAWFDSEFSAREATLAWNRVHRPVGQADRAPEAVSPPRKPSS